MALSYHTSRTTLTALSTDDIEEFVPLLKEPSASTFIPHLRNKTDEEYSTFLYKKIEAIEQQKAFYWVVRFRGALIGNVNLTPYEHTHDWHLGFRISEKYRQQGLATEVSHFAMEYAKMQLAKHILYGLVVPENKASQRTLQKLGFKLETITYSQTYEIDLEVWKVDL